MGSLPFSQLFWVQCYWFCGKARQQCIIYCRQLQHPGPDAYRRIFFLSAPDTLCVWLTANGFLNIVQLLSVTAAPLQA
jgi:hypothetical protein